MVSVISEALVLIGTILWQMLKAIALFFIPSSEKDVSNEIVLITGAGSGIGRLIAFHFAAKGSVVVCVDINKLPNEETANVIRSTNEKAFAYTCDCSRKEDIYRVAEEVRTNIGDVSILINNAGIVSGKKFLDTSDGLIQKTFEVNTLAHFWTTKAFLPSMLQKNRGHIVSIASSAGLAGIAGLCDYCSSKFGAIGFIESLQMELASIGKKDIHTTVVCPYLIDTGMFDGAKTRFPRLLPILDPEETVIKIMNGILTNQAVLIIPRVLYFLIFLKCMLPQECFVTISEFFGANSCMDNFKGRKEKKEV